MKKFLAYKTRSLWKGYNFIRLNKFNSSRNYIVKLKDKGKVVFIYNGRRYIKFPCIKSIVGYKLGQFILTKKIGMFIHNLSKGVKLKKSNKNVNKKKQKSKVVHINKNNKFKGKGKKSNIIKQQQKKKKKFKK
jgi:ribosomal protein S19